MLRIWEEDRGGSPTRRALDLLAAASSEHSPQDTAALARLPLGERDRRLFQLRRGTLGPELACQGVCPTCGERLEISLSTDDLLPGTAAPRETAGILRLDDLELRFRLPTSEDVLAAEAAAETEQAQQLLVSRCVLEALKGDRALPPDELTEEQLSALGEHLSTLDPLAETLFHLSCEACGHSWSQPLEIGEVFLEEIQVMAQRLLQEVSWLARGYGWCEEEILRLSPARRRAYLEMLWA